MTIAVDFDGVLHRVRLLTCRRPPIPDEVLAQRFETKRSDVV